MPNPKELAMEVDLWISKRDDLAVNISGSPCLNARYRMSEKHTGN